MQSLLDLKVILMETPETTGAAVRTEIAKFGKRLSINRRVMAILKCMHKRKMLGRHTLHNTTDQIIELIFGI
jgi:hypothetical protein